MKNDYLWDGSGEPDPDVCRLEKLLDQFRHPGGSRNDLDALFPEAESQERVSPIRRFARPRIGVLAAIAASLVVAIVVFSWLRFTARPGYEVVSLTGTPRVGAKRVQQDRTAYARTGQWIETDSGSTARVRVGLIGEVDVGPNTRLHLLRAQPTEHRLELRSGLLRARIWAPPRVFQVCTPSAVAVDLGCAYTLEVDPDGAGVLSVSSGWVAFERDGRESFVPAGAMCLTRPAFGPGTPFRSDAAVGFRLALEELDFGSGSSERRGAALETLAREARSADALTLWHVLDRCVEPQERKVVYDRLALLVPPPRGVTREGVVRGDRGMRDLWWDQLGLGGSTWWRMWKGPVPGSRE